MGYRLNVSLSISFSVRAYWLLLTASTPNRYLKHIDRYTNHYISAFLTGGNIKFLLLSCPDTHATSNSSARGASAASSARSSAYTAAAYNPTSPAVEEAMKNFFLEVYDVWVKTIMNPFYQANMPVRSPVFRARVAGAAKKYL